MDLMDIAFPNLGIYLRNVPKSFEVFGFTIALYGVIIGIGVIAGILMAARLAKISGQNPDLYWDFSIYAVIFSVIGARIYYVIFNWDRYRNDLLSIINTREGGMAIYGGVIAAFLTAFVYAKVKKQNFFLMADTGVVGLALGQAIGRWGNFVNQEAYGADCAADWPFAMKGSLITSQGITGVVHPCFLYESVWCLLGFIFLHIYSKKLRTFDGEVFLLYVAWYGLERFFVEGLRTDSLMAGDFRISQIVAAVSCIAALIVFVIFKIYTKKKNIPLYVNSGVGQELLESDRKAEEERLAKKAAKKNKKSPSILGDEEKTEDTEEKSEDAEDKAEKTEDTEEAAADNDEKSEENKEETKISLEKPVEEKAEEAAEDTEETVEEADEADEKRE